ncbi:glycine cleavage system protein GcvH [Rhodoblastus acidophilus]|uniref:Glycine cleavage system H protein n=1 Tax=Candidatus Rhodoblastus alkanivorans TaxID=2954117 RepID=A0ABS9ZA91_9HYPH|nr:glycine cleavage system protein GcvH [Candidatus Rhodoblastus alkanivorans]MCI4677257.1 glycine cleavage system protein GcvH [Candidatus Rhodoblastus alkanivorans]MCI4684609.1 glycine cleavage system protein GcvH [Candidatus Rhodoblastus alkanivorans]MDI4641931.1 glycine cleavage system protein GcvH [Rhodoblastus acidophilus]
MAEMLFTKDHEYILVEDGVGRVGITRFAQGQLGDIVFVELPEPGVQRKKGEETAVVESVKAASEVYAPVGGEVVEVNADLADHPALVNEDPHGDGWFFKIRIADTSELSGLLDQSAYDAFVATLA